MKRRIAALSILALVGLCAYFVLRAATSPFSRLQPFVVKEDRSYARLEDLTVGSSGAVENYVVREASLEGIAGEDLEEHLQSAFSKEAGWVWEFVRDKQGTLHLATAKNGDDEVLVTEISQEGCLVRYQKKADAKDVLLARAQNWGKDPFAQAPIEIRLGFAIAMD